MPLLAACQLPRRSGGMVRRSVRVPAPFDMPAIAIPDFSGSRRFPITDFNADQNDQGRTSAAIAVVVPPGTWPTGPVYLKSNVNLHQGERA